MNSDEGREFVNCLEFVPTKCTATTTNLSSYHDTQMVKDN
jgi:hypothetical protein